MPFDTSLPRRLRGVGPACALGLALAGGPAAAAQAAGPASAPHAYQPHLRPVARIAATRMRIDTPAGSAQFPLYLSRDWSQPLPGVTRAVIVIHGKLRNADRYFRLAEAARAAAREQGAAAADQAGTLLVAPQFLATLDLAGRDAPAALLRWDANGWMAGDDAVSPVPLSSYAVLDAIVARLADRRRFPNLKTVVLAGHSGGGQVVQRYAVAARETGRCPARASRCATWCRARRRMRISTPSAPARTASRPRSTPPPAPASTTGNTAWPNARRIWPTARPRSSRPPTRRAA